MESKRFGQAYKKYRQARGYSLKEAAGQTVSPQFLGQFERGEKGISLDTLDQLLDNIGLTWSDFLTEDGSQPEPDQTSPRMAQKGLFPADVQFLTVQEPCQPNPDKILNRLLQTQFFTHLELDFLASQVRTLPLSFFLKSGGGGVIAPLLADFETCCNDQRRAYLFDLLVQIGLRLLKDGYVFETHKLVSNLKKQETRVFLEEGLRLQLLEHLVLIKEGDLARLEDFKSLLKSLEGLRQLGWSDKIEATYRPFADMGQTYLENLIEVPKD